MDAESAVGIYWIGAVTEMTGISESTLRYWERKYGTILPERTEGGRRLYSLQDVERIHWLKQKIQDEDLRPGVAHRLLARELGATRIAANQAG